MVKYLKILLALLIGAVILLLPLLLNRKTRPEYFKQVQLNETIQVVNNTDQQYLDTIVSIGLDQLGIADVTVLLYPLSETLKQSSGGDLFAHIRESDGTFYIFLDDKLDRSEAITVISHELIHLKQYYEKRFIYKDGTVTWMGIKYKLEQIAYDERPWENEAFINHADLSKKIETFLYD